MYGRSTAQSATVAIVTEWKDLFVNAKALVMAGPYFDGGVAGESAEIVRNEGVGCVFEPKTRRNWRLYCFACKTTRPRWQAIGSAAATAQAATTERRWPFACLMS